MPSKFREYFTDQGTITINDQNIVYFKVSGRDSDSTIIKLTDGSEFTVPEKAHIILDELNSESE